MQEAKDVRLAGGIAEAVGAGGCGGLSGPPQGCGLARTAAVEREVVYGVCPDTSTLHCTSADYASTGERCKHIHAVEYVMWRERHEDGSATVTERLTVESVRKNYPQDWAAYNAAQVAEKHEFQALLYDLCQNVPSPPQGKGRPRLPMSDAVFSTTFKVYSTFSGRRFMSDLRDAHERGYISRVPHLNSVFNQLDIHRSLRRSYLKVADSDECVQALFDVGVAELLGEPPDLFLAHC